MPARFFPPFLPFDTEVFISALTATSAIINRCTDRAAYIERVANVPPHHEVFGPGFAKPGPARVRHTSPYMGKPVLRETGRASRLTG